jgi:hypothetical protein
MLSWLLQLGVPIIDRGSSHTLRLVPVWSSDCSALRTIKVKMQELNLLAVIRRP